VFAKKIGIDPGTTSTQVYVRGEGIVFDEPTAVALEGARDRLLAVGRQALDLAGRTPGAVRLVHPVQRATVTDPAVLERMLEHLVTRAQGRQRLFRPEVMLCVPAAADGDDRRALMQAAMAAGARQAWLIEAPLAAAMGLGLPISEARPHTICDLGGGTVQAAVISQSGVVTAGAVAAGGCRLDTGIAALVWDQHRAVIDQPAAEALKIAVGSAEPVDQPLSGEVRDQATGEVVTVTAAEVTEAIRDPLAEVARLIRQVVAETPARVARDIAQQGVYLTGGGAQLRGLDRHLARETRLPVRLADEPRTCAVRGTRRALGEFEVVQRRQLYLQ
jgi:rod shape-determining protein MreB